MKHARARAADATLFLPSLLVSVFSPQLGNPLVATTVLSVASNSFLFDTSALSIHMILEA